MCALTNMWAKGYIFILILTALHVVATKVCTITNITCSAIKDTAENFTFPFEMPKGTEEIEAIQNKIIIIQGNIDNLEFSNDIVRFDNTSVTKRTCQRFDMTYTFKQADGKYSDSCEIFDIIGEAVSKADSIAQHNDSWKPTVGGVIVALILACIAVAYYLKRKKKKGNGFQGQLADQRAEEDNNRNSEQEQEQGLLDAKDANREANGGNQDISIEMVDMINTSAAEGASQVNVLIPHEGQNGNMGHDPGGGKTSRLRSFFSNICPYGGISGAQSSDHDKDKEEQLPQNQRSAKSGREEESGGEDSALVDSSHSNVDASPHDEDKGATLENI